MRHIGNGAREHCIAETLKRSRTHFELICLATAVNPGIRDLCSSYHVGNFEDVNFVKDFALAHTPNFAFIGPENPISLGVADMLLDVGVKAVAPFREPARLESSKSFARDLLKKYEIPGNPRFRVFHTPEGIDEFMHELHGNCVIKADGLAGGKGVKVAGDHFHGYDEGLVYALECIQKFKKVVIEEKLIGQEFSLMSFVDGKTVFDMPAVQDHKRAFEDDRGPNTGGMGSYSDENLSLPFLSPKDLEAAHFINQSVVSALQTESGFPFKGILYGGFMATADGVRLIEYNVRFGDPEVMNVLPLLQTDFVDVCEAIISGELHQLPLRFERKATVVKYVVPEGYPDNPKKGAKIELAELPSGVKRYFASVNEEDGTLYLGGSRTVAFVGFGKNVSEAEVFAEKGANTVSGPVFHRKDIGTESLVHLRISMMRKLRS
ncbi:phosphoribosylamine--glycine ligase [Candidatus Peregrinibacteria bacterium]|nr:phosphoribosylamine--glycine ligase [Candidatus Peregrinibacteria bacterium]